MKKVWKAALLMLVASFFLSLPGAFAGKLDDIKARGTLIAGVKDSQPPFGYVDEATRQIVGLEPDLCAALAAKLGVKLELKPVTSATRIPMLDQGAIDHALGDGYTGHGRYAERRTEQAGQAGEVIHAQIKQRTASLAVEPLAPRRSLPPISSSGKEWTADVTAPDTPRHGLECRTEDDVWCGQQVAAGVTCQLHQGQSIF